MFSSRLLTWSQSLLAPLLIASRCVLGPMGQTSKNTPLIPKSHPPWPPSATEVGWPGAYL